MRFKGGAIKKPKRKEREKDDKIEQALAHQAQRGGSLYDAQHKYMMDKLSGHGAHHDSEKCRSNMHSIMSRYDPVFWDTYISGKVQPSPQTVRTRRQDARADIIETGGSLHPISHSENGFLESHNPEFHHYLEIV